MQKRRAGFTVMELLVVIGIISLLMALLLPAAERVRHQAYIDKCASNLRQIGLALQTYANENHGNFPRTVYDPTYRSPLVSGTGINAADPFTAGGVAANDLTAPIFLLMKSQHLVPEVLICPYNDDTSYVADSANLAGRSNFTNEAHNLAYSFANPYPDQHATKAGYRLNNHLPSSFAIGADRNPGIDAKEDNVDLPTPTSPASIMKKANSANHEKDGQNVLFADGHVSWAKSPFVGIAQDNIYAARDLPLQVESSPFDATDSVLLPSEDD